MWQILLIVLTVSPRYDIPSLSTQLSTNKYLTQEACNTVAYKMFKKITVGDKVVNIAAECIKIGD